MALLTLAKRKEYFKYLGLGEYNKTNILKLQKQYFTRKKDCDGLYGQNTDYLLRHVYNVKRVCTNFTPQEFKCECGGRYCTGYPVQMKATELYNLQTIRTHYGKPMRITSGLRCRGYNNSLRGSVKNSKHMTGFAADFYIPGVTDSLSGRKSLIAYLKKLPHFDYAYSNGWCSLGYGFSASYMGSAVHMQSYDGSLPKNAKLNPGAKTATTAAKTPAKTTTAVKAPAPAKAPAKATATVDVGTKVLNFAASQKGKYTSRTHHGKDGKKYSNKFTKYFAGRGGINSKGQMPNKYGYIPGYCTLFVCYCLEKCGLKSVVPFSTLNSKKNGYWWHAPSLMKWYKKKGLLRKDFSKAKRGAITFKGSSSPTHTCLFDKLSGGYVYTWDGNVGGGVTYNKRKKSVLIGYVNPPYKK